MINEKEAINLKENVCMEGGRRRGKCCNYIIISKILQKGKLVSGDLAVIRKSEGKTPLPPAVFTYLPLPINHTLHKDLQLQSDLASFAIATSVRCIPNLCLHLLAYTFLLTS